MQERPIEVLIVEDSQADVYLTEIVLRDAKIANRIHVVEDGEQALAFLNQVATYADAPRPDLVVLDLNLPKRDGYEVLAEMKANSHLKNISVIVVSGSARALDIARGYGLQIAAFVVKSLKVDDYFLAIRAVKEMWFHNVALQPVEKRRA
jgi:two-component system, chemotaxis family, response regulator Rcp1